MTKVDVKCAFCQQIEPVKKHDLEPPDINVTAVRLVAVAFNSRMKAQIVDLAMSNAGIQVTARVLNISINAVVRTLKNARRKT